MTPTDPPETGEGAALPSRRFELMIRISGDEWIDVIRDLEELALHIEQHGPECSSVSGGYSSGHTVTVVERPEQTREKYHAELDAYLARRRHAPRT